MTRLTFGGAFTFLNLEPDGQHVVFSRFGMGIFRRARMAPQRDR